MQSRLRSQPKGSRTTSNFYDKDFNCFGATHFLVFYNKNELIRHEKVRQFGNRT